MRLPRVRFTIRRLMIAVAVVGVGLGIEGYRRRLVSVSVRRRQVAMAYRLDAQMYKVEAMAAELERTTPKGFVGFTADNPSGPIDDDGIARRFRLATHYQELAVKYRRASGYPWLPVGPDPPAPE
jgi:hypothetical protein